MEHHVVEVGPVDLGREVEAVHLGAVRGDPAEAAAEGSPDLDRELWPQLRDHAFERGTLTQGHLPLGRAGEQGQGRLYSRPGGGGSRFHGASVASAGAHASTIRAVSDSIKIRGDAWIR